MKKIFIALVVLLLIVGCTNKKEETTPQPKENEKVADKKEEKPTESKKTDTKEIDLKATTIEEFAKKVHDLNPNYSIFTVGKDTSDQKLILSIVYSKSDHETKQEELEKVLDSVDDFVVDNHISLKIPFYGLIYHVDDKVLASSIFSTHVLVEEESFYKIPENLSKDTPLISYKELLKALETSKSFEEFNRDFEKLQKPQK